MAARREIEAGSAYVRLHTKDTAFVRGLKNAQAKLKAFGDKVGAIGARMTMVGGAILGALMGAAKGFASMGDELDKMSARVGASVEFLSALGHAAQIGGTDIKAMETGIRRMQRTAMDATRGLSTAVDTFDELGISVYGLDGQLKATEQLFMESAAALAKLENNTKKAALASMLFGRAGTQLLPMLKDGKVGLMAVMEEARELGLVMSTEDATAAAKLTDQMTRLYGVMKRIVFDVGAALAGEMGDLADRLTQTGKATAEWVRQNQEMIIGVAKLAAGVTVLGIALKGLAVLCAHPLLAGLIAVGYAIQATTGHTAELTREMERAREAGDRQRAADLDRLDALEKLAAKQSLTSDEMTRANALIGELQKTYGDLGVKVNEATGALEGFAAAQENVNAAMQEAAVMAIRAEMAERQRNVRELTQQAREPVGGPFAKMFLASKTAKAMEMGGEKRLQGFRDRIQTELDQLQVLMAKLEAMGGSRPWERRWALTGKRPEPGGGPTDLGIAGAAGAGGPGEYLKAIEAQEAAAQRLADEFERVKIGMMPEKSQAEREAKERAGIELQREQYMRQFKGMGLGPEVNELFQLRLAATEKPTEIPGITGRGRGTFYGEAASRLGKTADPNERTATNTKDCADALKEIADRGRWNRGIPVV